MAGQMPNFTNQGAMSIPGQIKSRELSWILSMLYFRDKIMCCKRKGKLTELITFATKCLINKANFCYLQRTLSLKGKSSIHSPPPTHKALYTYIGLYIHKYIRRSQTQNNAVEQLAREWRNLLPCGWKLLVPLKLCQETRRTFQINLQVQPQWKWTF